MRDSTTERYFLDHAVIILKHDEGSATNSRYMATGRLMLCVFANVT